MAQAGGNGGSPDATASSERDTRADDSADAGAEDAPDVRMSIDAMAGIDAGADLDAGGAPLGPVGSVCVPGASYGNPLPANPRATTIRMGFMEAEGPVWVASEKALFVSDIAENNLGNGSLMKYTPATGQWTVVASKVGPNGLALDVSGGIVAACHDIPGIYRFDPATGTRTKVTGGDSFEGKPFNEPNDVVVRTDGNIYFTDPKLQPGAKGRAGQGVTAYYRLSPSGVVTRIAVAAQPNGIALAPDGRSLYVAGGFGLRRHDVALDGAVASTFVTLSPSGSDGMGVDCAGNIYLTSGGAVKVLSPGGQPLGAIAVPSSGFITNVAFGGDDRKTLFITNRYAVHQLRVEVPGFPN